MESNSIDIIFKDNNDNLWFAIDGGVGKYDGNTWMFYTKDNNNLVNNFVNAVLEDNDGSFWFGTDDGISKFSYSLPVEKDENP